MYKLNNNIDAFSKEQFTDWINHPITDLIRQIIKKRRDSILSGLLNNIPAKNVNYLLFQGEMKGRINAYDDILNITYDQDITNALGD